MRATKYCGFRVRAAGLRPHSRRLMSGDAPYTLVCFDVTTSSELKVKQIRDFPQPFSIEADFS
jgi:hypothetical protein